MSIKFPIGGVVAAALDGFTAHIPRCCFLLPPPKVESMENSGEIATMIPSIRIVGEYNSVSSVQSISRLNSI